MSEDVTAVSMQVSEKAAEAALSAFKSVLDSVGRLFRELLGMEHDRARAKAQIKASKGSGSAPEKLKSPNLTATNLTGIKPGEVSMKDLAENARNTGEAISIAQNGFSQEDRRAIARTAKKYGIPVAFTNTKGKDADHADTDKQHFRCKAVFFRERREYDSRMRQDIMQRRTDLAAIDRAVPADRIVKGSSQHNTADQQDNPDHAQHDQGCLVYSLSGMRDSQLLAHLLAPLGAGFGISGISGASGTGRSGFASGSGVSLCSSSSTLPSGCSS